MKLFRDSAAADNFAPFQNQRLESTLGQIKRRDERIVTAADECYALSYGHVSRALWQNQRWLMVRAPSKVARHLFFDAARWAFSIP